MSTALAGLWLAVAGLAEAQAPSPGAHPAEEARGLAVPARELAGFPVALVIGNRGYDHAADLPQAPRDAELVANTLRRLGFDVTLVEEATLEQTRAALATFRRQLDGASIGVFYFAGHAVQIAGTNYLLPTDAELERRSEVGRQTVPISEVIATLAEGDAALNVVLLDACRNDPFPSDLTADGRATRVPVGLRPVQDRGGFLIGYATAPDDFAADSGVYARALAREIQRPCASWPLALSRVRDAVADETGGQQQPWLSVGAGEVAYASYPAGCVSVCSAARLQRSIDVAESAFVRGDAETFEQAEVEASRQLLCTERHLGPETAGSYHRLRAIAEWRNAEPELAEGHLVGLRASVPDHAWPPELRQAVPDLVGLEPDPRLARRTRRLPAPDHGWLEVDGALAGKAPAERPYVLQWMTDDNTAVFTDLVYGSELPAYPRAPSRTPGRLRLAGVLTAAVSGAIWATTPALDAASRRAFQARDLAAAERNQSLNRAAFVTGAAGVGTGVALFLGGVTLGRSLR